MRIGQNAIENKGWRLRRKFKEKKPVITSEEESSPPAHSFESTISMESVSNLSTTVIANDGSKTPHRNTQVELNPSVGHMKAMPQDNLFHTAARTLSHTQRTHPTSAPMIFTRFKTHIDYRNDQSGKQINGEQNSYPTTPWQQIPSVHQQEIHTMGYQNTSAPAPFHQMQNDYQNTGPLLQTMNHRQ